MAALNESPVADSDARRCVVLQVFLEICVRSVAKISSGLTAAVRACKESAARGGGSCCRTAVCGSREIPRICASVCSACAMYFPSNSSFLGNKI